MIRKFFGATIGLVLLIVFQDCSPHNFEPAPLNHKLDPGAATPVAAVQCSTGLKTTNQPIKMIFVMDVSAANIDLDLGKAWRDGKVRDFFSLYSSRTNFSWELIAASSKDTVDNAVLTDYLLSHPGDLEGATREATVSDAQIHVVMPLGSGSGMITALNTFDHLSDEGGMPYLSAIDAVSTSLVNDPELNSATLPIYVVFFMSATHPSDYNVLNGDGPVMSAIQHLLALAPGRVSFNSVYYGTPNAAASARLSAMAGIGNGKFLDTNISTAGLSFKINNAVAVPTVCN